MTLYEKILESRGLIEKCYEQAGIMIGEMQEMADDTAKALNYLTELAAELCAPVEVENPAESPENTGIEPQENFLIGRGRH